MLAVALVLLLATAACDSSDTDTDDDLDGQSAQIIDASYVNKTMGSERLDFSGGRPVSLGTVSAIDLTIGLSRPVSEAAIRRVLLYAGEGDSGTGWEASGDELLVDGAAVRVSNLQMTRSSNVGATDRLFGLSIDWTNGQTTTYRFVHNGVFLALDANTVSWIDQERLEVSLSARNGVSFVTPDSGRVVWMDGTGELGSMPYTASDLSGQTLRLDDVPAMADGFYLTAKAQTLGVAAESMTGTYPLPTRIPPNVAFVSGVPQALANRPFQFAKGDGSYFVVGFDDQGSLAVIDAASQSVTAVAESSDRVFSLEVANGFAYVGRQSGTIEEITLATGQSRTLALLGPAPQSMVRIGDWLVVSGRTSDDFNTRLLSIDLSVAARPIVSNEVYDEPSSLVFSPLRGRLYGSRGSRLASYAFDASTGAITDVQQTFNGNYSAGGELTLLEDQTRLVSADQGSVFSTTADLAFVGRFAFPVYHLTPDPAAARAYAVRGQYNYYQEDAVLDVYALPGRTLERSVALYAAPLAMSRVGSALVVFGIQQNMGTMGRRFTLTTYPMADLAPMTAPTGVRMIVPTAR